MRTDYCVYTHLRPNDSIFYVGKGVPSRPYNKTKRSALWKKEVANNGFTVNIVKANLTEQEAFNLEIRLIKKLRQANANLVNLTNGGDGFKELCLTDEMRKKLSDSKVGKNNPMYGKPITEEHREKLKLRKPNKAWLCKKMPKDVRKKMSESHKNKPTVECPHCNKIGKEAGMKVWHMDNCKNKEVI